MTERKPERKRFRSTALRIRLALTLPALAALCYTSAMAINQHTVYVNPASQAVEPFWVLPGDDLRLIIKPPPRSRYDIAWSKIVIQSDNDTVLWTKASHTASADIYKVANAFPGTEFMSVIGSLTPRGGGGGGGGGQMPIFQVTVPEVDIDWDKPGYREEEDEAGEDNRILWIGPNTVEPFVVRRPIEKDDKMFPPKSNPRRRPLPDLEVYLFSDSGLVVYATQEDALAGENAITFPHDIHRETWKLKSTRLLRFFAKQNPAQKTLPQTPQEIRLKRIDRNNKNPTGFEGDYSGGTYDCIKFRPVRPDIDVDTNNDGEIESDDDGEDQYEQYEPGLLLDRFDAQAENSGQLKEIKLSGFPQGAGLEAKLTQTGDAVLQIHVANNPTSQQFSLDPTTAPPWTDTNPPPLSLWVQGRANGTALLKFSVYDPAKPAETIAFDEVCLTVLEPASYSPSGSDFYSIWFPLNPANGAPSLPQNNLRNLHGNLDTMISLVCSQGSETRIKKNVVLYTDETGDQDTDFGSCTLANLKKMADSGFIQFLTHGPEGGQYLCAVFAPQTDEGKAALKAWGREGTKDLPGLRIEKQSSATSDLKCYAAWVPSSWFESNWRAKVNANKSMVVWDVCYSSMYMEPEKSLMNAAEGRWRIGYANETANVYCAMEHWEFFGKLSAYPHPHMDATKRSAGKAYGPLGSITRMNGNPWTTLYPTLTTLPPKPIGTHPGTEQIGWGCIVFDTYIQPTGSASDALEGAGKAFLSKIRWVNVGAGCRAIGFNYDFTKDAAGTGPTLEVIADKIISQGNGGGQVLDGNGRPPNRDNSIHKLY